MPDLPRPSEPDPAPPPGELREAQDRFVAAWGQMAGAWGISRTMAEIHALLFITGEPMSADDIMDRLSISRGNASMSLRALVEWGIVVRTHKRGQRREYFLAEQDIWTMFRMIVRERIRREVDPLLTSLCEIRDLTGMRSAHRGDATLRAHNERVDSLVSFFQIIQVLGERFASPSGEGLRTAATLLSEDLLGRGDGPAGG